MRHFEARHDTKMLSLGRDFRPDTTLIQQRNYLRTFLLKKRQRHARQKLVGVEALYLGGSYCVIKIETAPTRAHRNNIRRYNRLLETHLTDVERNYVKQRLAEERAILQGLQSCARGYRDVPRINLE